MSEQRVFPLGKVGLGIEQCASYVNANDILCVQVGGDRWLLDGGRVLNGIGILHLAKEIWCNNEGQSLEGEGRLPHGFWVGQEVRLVESVDYEQLGCRRVMLAGEEGHVLQISFVGGLPAYYVNFDLAIVLVWPEQLEAVQGRLS